jgi:hypothetical protein
MEPSFQESIISMSQKTISRKKEGLAKFSQLWPLKNNEWKMTVILSYDHGPAPMSTKLKMSASN